MELRHPQFNFMPRHTFATKLPDELKQLAANVVAKLLKGHSEI
jgi:hypothetical protein